MSKLADFRPATKNANKHTVRGLRDLDKSLEEDGFVSPITAAADGEVLAGSARLERVAEKFDGVEPLVVHHRGDRPIIMVRDDVENAKTPHAKRIAIRDNRTAEIGLAWDAEVLFEEMEAGLDLGPLGFDERELAEIFDGFDLDKVEFPEYGEDTANNVEFIECPKCGERFPK